MVDTLVSGASASRRVGSTPISGTIDSAFWLGLFFVCMSDPFIFTINY